MPTTPLRALRYPASSNTPNVPQDIQNLASDVDNQFAVTYAYPTISANWAQANNAYGGATINEKVACWLDVDHVTVHCVGAIINTASVAANTVYNPWITIPSGYRPAVGIRRYAYVSGNNNNSPTTAPVEIYATGAAALGNVIALGANTLFSFEWKWRITNA